jgi:hypothetical protein
MGYGKPPPKNRLKKGMSGNPEGHPKRTASAKQSFHEVFAKKIPATVDGEKAVYQWNGSPFLATEG